MTGARFVRREIVGDDVDLFASGLVDHDVGEEGDEFRRGVTRRGLAENFASLVLKAAYKRQRAVAEILKAMALSAPGRQRQHRIFTVQRLNSGLLIDAEHRGMRRRIQIQADDIGGLGLEVRIVGEPCSVRADAA